MKKVMIAFMIFMFIIVLIGCSNTDEKQTPIEQLEEAKTQEIKIIYKNQLSINTTNPQLPTLFKEFIQDSPEQTAELNELQFQVNINGASFDVYKNGVTYHDKNYKNDTSSLINEITNSFLSLNTLDILNVESCIVNFRDTNYQINLNQEVIDLLKHDLKSSRTLNDPPMIFGVPYPDITIHINDFSLTWLSSDIVQLKLSDDYNLGWIQVSNSQWWKWLQTNHNEELKRTSLFSKKAKYIVISDSSVPLNDQNRLDQFWRIFSKSIKQEYILNSGKAHVSGARSLTFIDRDHNPIITVWSDDIIEYEGKTYLKENIFQDIESLLTAG